MTEQEFSAALDKFSGTETWTRYRGLGGGKGILFTDGVHFLVEHAKAWWLLDAILSYQARALRDDRLREIQFWTLDVTGSSAVLTCERDSDDVAFRQEIDFTDFPLKGKTKLYLELGSVDGVTPEYVLMLPSER